MVYGLILLFEGSLKCYVMQWGWGGVYGSAQISVEKVYGPTLLALQRGGVEVSNFKKMQ